MLGPTYKIGGGGGGGVGAAGAGPAARALQASALVLLAVLGSAANALVIAVFQRRPALRSPSNRFVMSLVLANLVSSLCVAPLLLVQVFQRDGGNGAPLLRQLAAGFTTLAVTAAIFSILAIAVDRYNAVLAPLHYAMTITRGRSRGMIAGAWGVAALLAAPPLLGALLRPTSPGPQSPAAAPPPSPAAPPQATLGGVGGGSVAGSGSGGLLNCTAGAGGEVFRLTYALVLVTLGFTLPLFALCWIYARMYKAAHRNSERTRRHSVSVNPSDLVSRHTSHVSHHGSRGPSVDFTQPSHTATPETFRRFTKAPPLAHTMLPKRRCSNASFSALLFREEGKAVKTAAMVIASYLFCWTMYFATVLADTWGNIGANAETLTNSVIPEHCRFLAVLFALSSGCITPFIYVFRNEEARREALKIVLWWRGVGKYGSPRRFEGLNGGTHTGTLGKSASVPNHATPPVCQTGFGPNTQDNFALRRQSLSFCDSISVQSLQIPTAAGAATVVPPSECRHCSGDPAPGLPTADFVATYEVVESPVVSEATPAETAMTTAVAAAASSPERPQPAASTRTRRESVTFRLAFLPPRRCQTCIRQNSDSSSGSGHPLLRDTDSVGSGSGRTDTAKARRQQFLLGRQGSSGEELLCSGSESGTPRHYASISLTTAGTGATPFRRGPLAIEGPTPPVPLPPPAPGLAMPVDARRTSPPAQTRHLLLTSGTPTEQHGGAVILELDEQTEPPRSGGLPRAVAVFQFQETSLEGSETMTYRQDSTQSDCTIRQDSNRSDATVDSGVVADAPPSAGTLLRSQSSSSSLCSVGLTLPPVKPRTRARRHRLQRLAAVEDDEEAPDALQSDPGDEEPDDDVEEDDVPQPPSPTDKGRKTSGFRARFPRPAFRLPRCEF